MCVYFGLFFFYLTKIHKANSNQQCNNNKTNKKINNVFVYLKCIECTEI